MNQEATEPIETAARENLWHLIQAQAADLTRLIAEGQFPLSDQSAGRFNLIPGAAKAIERVDQVWMEMVKANRERNTKGEE